MKKLLLLAGAAMMVGAAPALAKPGGGKGNAPAHVSKGAPAHAQGHKGMKGNHPAQHRVDRNRNGIADWDEAMARRYGGELCPPGLAKKTPACVPPGQAQRMFREGQRLPANYRYFTDYNTIPHVLRDRYSLNGDYRYIYRNNTIYVVDPRTSLVTRIIDAIL